MLRSLSPEVLYILVVVGLFLVPRVLQRFHLPSAITSVGLGAALGMGLHAFEGDTTVPLLATLGIVSLFLFAGLEVDFEELRRGKKVVLQHLGLQTLLLLGGALVLGVLFGLEGRPALLLSLAIFTPSTGFILDSLEGFRLSPEQRFWVKSKAIASEFVALAVLFVVVQSAHAKALVASTVALVAMIAGLPPVFRAFARRVLPYAPKSEFTFLVIVALLCAYATRRLGVYYLVGAFVVGVTAVRMRRTLPELASEKVLGAVELFASFFIPFYFFKAGLHLRSGDFTWKSLGIGLALVAVAVPLRVLVVAAHRRASLGELPRDGLRVGRSLVPTLVFTIVLADILEQRFSLPRDLFGGLMVFTLVNTLLPGLVLRGALPEYDAPKALPVEGDAPPSEPPPSQRVPSDPPSPRVPMPTLLSRLEDGLYRLAGGEPSEREALVTERLRRLPPASARYFTEWTVATVLGALALVQARPALAFVAALLAPIGRPIVGLAMGLASGSPFLVLRTVLRSFVSVGTGLLLTVLVVRALPFREVTEDIASRSTPTLLDLSTAVACALALVLGALRPGSPISATAERIAVGIVVMPPMAVTGYGIAAGDASVAAGAFLSLVVAVSVLVAVGLLGFLLLGFHGVDVERIESLELAGAEDEPVLHAMRSHLGRWFGARYGRVVRWMMPVALVASAYVPLMHAFDEVAFEARVRSVVDTESSRLDQRVVQTHVVVRRPRVDVELVQIGSREDAERTRARLERRIASIDGSAAHVEVVSIPDVSALEGIRTAMAPFPPVRAPSTDGSLAVEGVENVRRTLGRYWPAAAVGELLSLEIEDRSDRLRIAVTHLGSPLGHSGVRTLEQALEAELGIAVTVQDRFVPGDELPLSSPGPEGLAELGTYLERAATTDDLVFCAGLPPEVVESRRPPVRGPDATPDPLRAFLATRPRVTVSESEVARGRFRRGGCPRAPSTSP